MLPTVQIGAIDGGNAFKPGTRPDDGYLRHRQNAPDTPPLAIKRELEQVCERVRKRESDILNIESTLSNTPAMKIQE